MFYASDAILAQYGHIIDKQINHVLPAWILDNFNISIVSLEPNSAEFELAHNPDLFRHVPNLSQDKPRKDAELGLQHTSQQSLSEKNLLCGQAIMALADTLLIFPAIAAVGQEREMVTLNSSTEFLRPIYPGKITIKAEIIRLGKTVIRGQVKIFDKNEKLSSITTICYMFIN